MNRTVKFAGLALALFGAYRLGGYPGRAVTAASQSPDGKWRALVVERGSFLDRNFDLELERADGKENRVVFRSPDEGRRGYEKLVWSADSSRLLLAGGSFYVDQKAALPSGDQLYLLLDVPSGRIWCNASQNAKYPRFGPNDLKDRAWTGWTPPGAAAPLQP